MMTVLSALEISSFPVFPTAALRLMSRSVSSLPSVLFLTVTKSGEGQYFSDTFGEGSNGILTLKVGL